MAGSRGPGVEVGAAYHGLLWQFEINIRPALA